jgi:hypothetical protein
MMKLLLFEFLFSQPFEILLINEQTKSTTSQTADKSNQSLEAYFQQLFLIFSIISKVCQSFALTKSKLNLH